MERYLLLLNCIILKYNSDDLKKIHVEIRIHAHEITTL